MAARYNAYTIAVGTAFEGIQLHGLFDTANEAGDIAIREFDNCEWSVIPIQDDCDDRCPDQE